VTGRCRGGHFAKLRADLRADFADRETSMLDWGRSLMNQRSQCSSLGASHPQLSPFHFTRSLSALPNFPSAKWAHLVHQVPRPLRLAASLTDSHDVGQLATPDKESARMTVAWAPHAQGQCGETWSSSGVVTYEAERAPRSETPAAAFGSKTRLAR
jgi:hypothetical protein